MGAMPCVRDKGHVGVLGVSILEKVIPLQWTCESGGSKIRLDARQSPKSRNGRGGEGRPRTGPVVPLLALRGSRSCRRARRD